MNSILFPTDFSENARIALAYAVELAEHTQSKLLLFHSYWMPLSDEDSPASAKNTAVDLKKQTMEKLQTVKEDIKRAKPNLQVEIQLSNDLFVQGLLQIVDDMRIDLIVMGTKGASGMSGVLLGSNTTNIIEKANVPVLAVPSATKWTLIDKIAFATDFNESDFDEILLVTQWAKNFKAELTLLHVSENEQDVSKEKNMLESVLTRVKSKSNFQKLNCKVLIGTDTTETLNNYAGEVGIDILAMTTRKRSFWGRLFGKSHTKEMIFNGTTPIFAFHMHPTN